MSHACQAAVNRSTSGRSAPRLGTLAGRMRPEARLVASVARARCSALFTAAGLAWRICAVSAAEKASTSRSSSAARWRGGSSWMTVRKANWTLSRTS